MFFDFASFLPRAVMQGIPLLYGSTGEILTEKSGNLNLGIPGVMYVGGICGVIGAFFYEQSVPAAEMSALAAIGIPMLCSLAGSLLMGLIYCLLTVTLRANQNVTGLALTTFGVGVGNFFGGSLIKLSGSEVPSIALSATSAYFSKSLPIAETTGWFGQVFLSYGFLAYLAIVIALLASYFLKHTRPGLHLRAVELDRQRRAQKTRHQTQRQTEVQTAAGVNHRDHCQNHDRVPAEAVGDVRDLREEVHARDRREDEQKDQEARDDHARQTERGRQLAERFHLTVELFRAPDIVLLCFFHDALLISPD